MTDHPSSSNRVARARWTREKLKQQHAIALGFSLEPNSLASYSSALQCYLNFCRLHELPIEPTPDTLSLFVAYECHYIKPKSVDSYLSGIANQLEPFFPNARSSRKSIIVARTLRGCKKRFTSTVKRKQPLLLEHLKLAVNSYPTPRSHNDKLFLTILLTGFYALLRLGELVQPNKLQLRDWHKLSLRPSVTVTATSYSFYLPGSKSDVLFEGDTILVQPKIRPVDPLPFFIDYLNSRDSSFPYLPQLWINSEGKNPTRSWFLKRFRKLLPNEFAGHSLRSGGATALAEAGIPPHLIQDTGRWKSEAWKVYIRKHPVLLSYLLTAPAPAHAPTS
jgi:hypothetical protein